MLFDPAFCTCEESEEHRLHREAGASMTVDERLLRAIFEPSPPFAIEECDQCKAETIFAQNLTVLGYPPLPDETDFDAPTPDDIILLLEVYTEQRVKAMTEQDGSGDRVPLSAIVERTMYWANISDEDNFHRLIEVGAWIAWDRKWQLMNKEERDESRQNERRMMQLWNMFLESDDLREHLEENQKFMDALGGFNDDATE